MWMKSKPEKYDLVNPLYGISRGITVDSFYTDSNFMEDLLKHKLTLTEE
ncbi:hypothetical protein T4E_12064 [Trichinella pseudospiralis]|uniref:Uncharacterized protein n=1 Tax=Trichinella pseudospiralis TaxID=6337 RepID=A0A0V0YK47_TRIPS|nr:hypothetical protein T4E_12064 [Trichinella pseudospiralis]